MSPETPKRFLVGSAALVGASTALLPSITGYGTQLFQFVVLGAWLILALLSSGTFADRNHPWVWFLALIINLVLFLIPALAVFLPTRKRSPVLAVWGLLIWLGFYLAALFFLFPATDGP